MRTARQHDHMAHMIATTNLMRRAAQRIRALHTERDTLRAEVDRLRAIVGEPPLAASTDHQAANDTTARASA
jgi:outer membrane murein-binding lipoprotein Lpp